jgi:ANTAR domain/GAF domain
MLSPDEATTVPVTTISEATPLLDLQEVAEAMRALSVRASLDDGRSPLQRLVQISVEQVPGARWASVTMLRNGAFTTPASTDDAATRADLLQYEIGSGPCVDAVLDDSLYVTGDVEFDPRWAAWGRRAASEVGVHSVLALRLHLHNQSDAIAGLNIYSDETDAFDDTALGLGLVLATHASLAVSEMLAQDRADNLMRALESNREIGVAMGVLMHRHQLTREQAFDVLRVASQDSNRKLADIAVEVANTGVLSIRRRATVGGKGLAGTANGSPLGH